MEDQSRLDTRWDRGWRPPGRTTQGERRGSRPQLAHHARGGRPAPQGGRLTVNTRMYCGSTEANLPTVYIRASLLSSRLL